MKDTDIEHDFHLRLFKAYRRVRPVSRIRMSWVKLASWYQRGVTYLINRKGI